MPIVAVHAYLVHPGRNNPGAAISGNNVALVGKVYEMLESIFSANPEGRDFEVTFKPLPNGVQQNDCRDLLIAYHKAPSLEAGRKIAERLRLVTDNRSGIGLLFLISGQHGPYQRLVISRFPANQAILAEVNEKGLGVEFLEQVFIRRMTAYKALMLEHQNPSAGFWSGMATDRQAGGEAENISNYWISDFLTADFSETAAAGTRRLAEALKNAIKKNPSLQVKSEIAAAVSLAPSVFSEKVISIDEFCNHFGFSEATRQTIVNQLSKPSLSSKKFLFSNQEFKNKIPYRTVELENGAILTAPSGKFEQIFEVRQKGEGKVEYATEGRISDQRIEKR
ncbi:MAG TPA: hypothetical protein PKD99_10850 [Sphingopyxis sp.]|nr:hypothetical protein [Sphingopyxis sp.]HMP45594.1 hypothetical protein [Sphingopyxis sp.]HMQ17934.1 hypothetical protein [Sphingopyxis sp.]